MNLHSHSISSLQGVLTVPGDKSISHRAAILGGLAEGVTEVDNFLCSEDCLNTLRAMEQLGAKVDVLEERQGYGPVRFRITGVAMSPKAPERPIDCGNSGTGMRLLAGMLAAGIYGAIVAVLKVKFGTNETLMTLMFNYVALYFLIFLGETQAEWNFFLDTSSARPVFFNFGKEVAFPRIMIGKFGLNVCVLLTLLIGALVYCYLKYSKHGYEIAVVGDSAGTAHYAGMKVNTIVLRTVFLSACLIGLAAAFKVGTVGILSTSFTDDVGWTGVIVAWLAQLNTGIIFVVSALISMLQHGSTVAAATFAQVDSSFADMLQGAILFLVLAADFFIRFQVVRAQKGGSVNGNG